MKTEGMTLGEYLRWYRYNKVFLTQKEFAERIGITRRTYVALENDNHDFIGMDTIAKISAVTKLSMARVNYLFSNTKERLSAKK